MSHVPSFFRRKATQLMQQENVVLWSGNEGDISARFK